MLFLVPETVGGCREESGMDDQREISVRSAVLDRRHVSDGPVTPALHDGQPSDGPGPPCRGCREVVATGTRVLHAGVTGFRTVCVRDRDETFLAIALCRRDDRGAKGDAVDQPGAMAHGGTTEDGDDGGVGSL